MKTKSFLLGFGEGGVVAIAIPLVLYLKKHALTLIGFELDSSFWMFALIAIVFTAVFLITNNVRKLVFIERTVPTNERVIECCGGLVSIVLITSLVLYFS